LVYLAGEVLDLGVEGLEGGECLVKKSFVLPHERSLVGEGLPETLRFRWVHSGLDRSVRVWHGVRTQAQNQRQRQALYKNP